MKRIFLLGLAACLTFLATELVVRYLVGYPTYGIEKKVKIRDIGWSNIWKPHSKYWNVEGGNRVFKNNNVGLPGIDVKVGPDIRYIAVLGSSFVEARQVPPEKMATSLLQNELEKQDPNLQVLNLGYSGHDPYDSYRRLAYFEQYFKIEKVILVLNSTFSDWLKRHKLPLNFKIPKQFAMDRSRKSRLRIETANQLAYLNLIGKAINHFRIKKNRSEINDIERNTLESDQEIIPELILTFQRFIKKYDCHFICCSILPDQTIWNEHADALKGMNFYHSHEVGSDDNRFNQTGHLNEKGHDGLFAQIKGIIISNKQNKTRINQNNETGSTMN